MYIVLLTSCSLLPCVGILIFPLSPLLFSSLLQHVSDGESSSHTATRGRFIQMWISRHSPTHTCRIKHRQPKPAETSPTCSIGSIGQVSPVSQARQSSSSKPDKPSYHTRQQSWWTGRLTRIWCMTAAQILTSGAVRAEKREDRACRQWREEQREDEQRKQERRGRDGEGPRWRW